MKITQDKINAHARRYIKVEEWSDEDGVFIGSALPLIGQCCHGTTEAAVLRQLTKIVNEWVEHHLCERNPLPEAAAAREYSGKFLVRLSPEVHKRVALQAMARGESLNQFVAETLASA